MSRTLGRAPDQWNTVAQIDHVRSAIERRWERWLWRERLPDFDAVELRVLGFIKSRTLDWQKFAEAIPKTHFRVGFEGEDEEGRRLCAGTGIAKDDTIRLAVKRLRDKGAITVFEGVPGTMTAANVYMPFAEDWVAPLIVEFGGVLPNAYGRVILGEYLVTKQDGFLWTVCDVIEEGVIVENYRRPSRIEIFPLSDFRRPGVNEVPSRNPKTTDPVGRTAQRSDGRSF